MAAVKTESAWTILHPQNKLVDLLVAYDFEIREPPMTKNKVAADNP